MFVSNFMSKPARTVGPETLVSEAREIMAAENFRHLPVTDNDGLLLGIITDRDIRSALPSALINEGEKNEYLKRFATLKIRRIMTEVVTSLSSEATLDDALILFGENKVGALPVVDEENHLVGILAVRDLLKAYKELFGLGQRGSSLIAVRDDGKPKPLTRLTEVLEARQMPFTRLIRTDSDDQGHLIYVRVHTYNLSALYHALAEAGFEPVAPLLPT
jgi:acetoin utilization protein AcuB